MNDFYAIADNDVIQFSYGNDDIISLQRISAYSRTDIVWAQSAGEKKICFFH